MLLTTKIHIDKHKFKDYEVLEKMCYHSARMYNVGLYSVRQHFFNTGKTLSYYNNYHLCKTNENYSILLTDTGQQILRLVDRDMHSFFGLLKLKSNGKYPNPIHLPKYKDKNGMMTCTVQGRSVRIKDGKAKIGLTKEMVEMYGFPKKHIEFTMPKNINSVGKIKELRITPQYGGKQFSVEFVYDSEQLPNFKQVDGDGFMSVDVGVDNLMACAIFSNGRSYQFIIDGKPIKSINAYYNKMVAKLKSDYSKNRTIKSNNTKRMLRLYNGRTNRINEYFNKTAKLIVEKCFEYGVSKVVIGYNKESKQGIGIGRANNQNLCYIPFNRLRQKLECKCGLHGIDCVFQEESYTSKASCIDMDAIPVYGDSVIPVFSGKRIKRGLYRSSDGYFLNSDINGSVNILRKYFMECKWNWCFQDHVRAFVNRPVCRINALRH